MIIIFFLFLALCGIIYFIFLNKEDLGKVVEIKQNNQLIKTISLKNLSENEQLEFVIDSEKNGFNKLKCTKNAVWIEDSNCSDKACVYSGKITKPYQQIICLPHHLVVTILPENLHEKKKDDLDTVVY